MADGDEAGAGAASRVGRALRELDDVHFQRHLARPMLPGLYLFLVAGWAYALGWLVWWTFQLSMWLGWVHLLLVFPAGLLGGAMFVRALLEFGAAVLEIREHVIELGTLPERVSSWPAVQRIAALTERRGWIVRRTVGARPGPSDREPWP